MRKNNFEKNYSEVYNALEINTAELPDLSKYYDKARRMTNSPCIKSWGSPERYVNALYWMKFVKKYDWIDIAKVTGNNYVAVRYNFAPFGWYNDYMSLEECELHEFEAKKRVEIALENYEADILQVHSYDYIETLNGLDDKMIHAKTRKTFGVKNEKELYSLFYYLFIVKELATQDIATYYDTTVGNLRIYFRKYGISISKKEARERIEAAGKGNHIKARTSYQKKVLKHALEAGLSNEYELLFRDLLGAYILDYIDPETYEVIIGIQTFTIVPPQEIDVPVIFIEKQSNRIYKYAIELNGDIWHEKENAKKRDNQKVEKIEKTEWKMVTINFSKNVTSPQKLKEAFIKLTNQVCKLLTDDLRSEHTETWKRREIRGF